MLAQFYANVSITLKRSKHRRPSNRPYLRRHPQQDPVRAVHQRRLRPPLRLQPNRVPHVVADGLAPLGCDALRRRHRRQPPRLRADDAARLAPRPAVVDNVLRDLGRLPAARLPTNEDDLVLVHDAKNFLPANNPYSLLSLDMFLERVS